MRMTGTWNDFAVERAESRKEICANIVANDDCFEVRISARAVRCLQSQQVAQHCAYRSQAFTYT